MERDQPTAERPLAKVLQGLRQSLVPIDVSGRVETLYSRTRDGWIVTIVNNEGITKTFRDAPVIDPAAAQTVTVTWRGGGKVRRATLWGADADTALDPRRIRVTVPPGEVRVMKLAM